MEPHQPLSAVGLGIVHLWQPPSSRPYVGGSTELICTHQLLVLVVWVSSSRTSLLVSDGLCFACGRTKTEAGYHGKDSGVHVQPSPEVHSATLNHPFGSPAVPPTNRPSRAIHECAVSRLPPNSDMCSNHQCTNNCGMRIHGPYSEIRKGSYHHPALNL